MHRIRICASILLSVLVSLASASQEMAHLRLRKILEKDYNKRQAPSSGSGSGGATVTIALHIHEIILDDEAMSMRIQSDVVQSWIDGRLAPVTKDTKDIYLGPEFSDLLWTPVLTIWNNRDASSFVPQDKQRVILLTANGRIIMEQRLLLDVACTNFTSHMRPLVCSVQLQQRKHPNSEIVYEWDKITSEPLLSIPRYTLAKMETGDCTRTTPTGTFSCKQLALAFRSNVNFFATEIYGVTFLLVILSWIGFWVEGHGQRQLFVRLGLGLSILLVLVLYGIGFRVLHNKVGMPGNVEVWVAFCILFVLASLVEFTFVHVLLRIIPLKIQRLFCRREYREEEEERGNFFKAAQVIDVTCGLLFPLIFVLFNVVYWGTY